MARKLLLFGAAVVAAGIFLKRDKVAGLLPSRTEEPYVPPAPGPSNYDAPGPVANTATPVPAPEPQEPAAIDERAEEAAAAAEAANIGGSVSDYAGPVGETADEEYRPLAEAGEGESEGEEQAEFDLQQAAEPTAPGMSDTERQIEDTIEQAANPMAGETLEPVRPVDEPEPEPGPETTGWAPPKSSEPSPSSSEPSPSEPAPSPAGPESPPSPAATEPPTEVQDTGVGQGGQVPKPDEPAPFDEQSTSGSEGESQPATKSEGESQPATESEGESQPATESEGESKGDEGTDWRTWSGRSINP